MRGGTLAEGRREARNNEALKWRYASCPWFSSLSSRRAAGILRRRLEPVRVRPLRRFTDEKAFESSVAGYLGVQSVDCKKLEATKVTCTTNEGREVIVLCLSADCRRRPRLHDHLQVRVEAEDCRRAAGSLLTRRDARLPVVVIASQNLRVPPAALECHLSQWIRAASLSAALPGVQLGQNLRGLPIRLGTKSSPHFAHVLTVVACSAKINLVFRARASTLRFSLAATWRGVPCFARVKKADSRIGFRGLPVSQTEGAGNSSTSTWGRTCLQRLECSLRSAESFGSSSSS
jgi:hypothetical protein